MDDSAIVRKRLNNGAINVVSGDSELNGECTVIREANCSRLKSDKVPRDIFWGELVDGTRAQLMVQFEEHLGRALNDLVDKAKVYEVDTLANGSISDYLIDKRVVTTNGNGDGKLLPSKIFRRRNSILTDLLEWSHFRTVYHIFIALAVVFSVNAICHDLLDTKANTSIFHVEFFAFAFGGFREVVLFWLKMFSSTLFVPFLGFLLWYSGRPADKSTTGMFDWFMLAAYFAYQVAFSVIPVQFVLQHKLPPASTAIVILEQVRMFMKSHAFIRSSLDSVLRPEESNHSQNNNRHADHPVWSPDFSHYLYFLFAPTLVYREHYPRTNEIRWGYVVSNLTQVIGCILLSYYVLVKFCFSEFVDFGRRSDYTFRQFLLTSTATSVPGGLVMLLTFFAALHSWLNAFAEMLRFGDRLFYKDWWNSTNFSGWYRTWNVVVHDWLYTYMYRDIQLVSRSKHSRTIAMAVVFGVSAVVHEYVLTIALRFFYPILFVFFTFAGYPFMYLKGSSRGWNVFIWVCLFTGWGQMMCLYTMEWYARRNCEPVLGNWMDWLIPHSWFCRPITDL